MPLVITAPTPVPELYRNAVVADNPVAYYRMNETSGTTITDEMGNSDGTISGTYALGAEGAISLSGENRCIDFTDAAIDCGFNTQYSNTSLEFWINAGSQTSGEFPAVIGKNQFFASSFANFPMVFVWAFGTGFVPEEGRFILSIGDDYTADVELLTGALSAGWHHIVCVHRDSALCELFVDGALIDSDTLSANISVATFNWSIGSAANENGGGVDKSELDGLVDEAAIYNYALTSTQVLNHYNIGIM